MKNYPAQAEIVRIGDEDVGGLGEDKHFMGLDLRRVISLLHRNKLWIALTCAGFVIAGLIVTMLLVPTYKSSAQVMVEGESEQIIEGADLSPDVTNWDTERFLQGQVDILESRTLANLVLEEGNLVKDPAFFAALGVEVPERSELSEADRTPEGYRKYVKDFAARALMDAMSTQLPAQSRVISITVEANDPKYAAKLANLYASVFIDNNLNRKFSSSSYARNYLSDQLDQARVKLEQSERDLNQYSRAAGLIRLQGTTGASGGTANTDSAISVTKDTLINLNTATSNATAQRIATEQAWNAVKNQPVLSVPEVLSNSAVQQLMRQKAEVQAELAQERSRHLPEHPTVIGLQAQVDELDDRIESIGKSIKQSIRLSYETAKDNEEMLRGQVDTVETEALDEQNRGVQYNVLKRVADTNRSLYDILLTRYNQLNAAAGVMTNNISIVDSAEVPVRPSSPNLIQNLLLSLLLGLLVSAGLVLLREYFDDTIREPSDVETKLDLPLLGIVPKSADPEDEIRDPRSALWESYHSLVTNLMYSTGEGLPKVLALTSAQQGEGKSTSSFAIARDLAALGKRVLLIDADLRRPRLHARLPNRDQVGLSSLLIGENSLESIIVPSGIENLSYVTALPIPPNPSILLGGPRFAELLNKARETYDVVIVDCPPLLGLSDTALIAPLVDGMLMMVNAEIFRKGTIKSALRRLKLVDAPLLGAVLSKFDFANAEGDYSYYRYDYYNYGGGAAAGTQAGA